MSTDAFFLPLAGGPSSAGQRFCTYDAPAAGSTARGAVLFVHPFAEEMNKSRRMAALQSRALAARGYGVLRIDLAGCGDSSGDFADASWRGWTHDVAAAAAWLQRRAPGPLWLWGLRAGCLVAADAAPRIGGPINLLLWQPAVSGRVVLQQFLRLRAMAEMIDGDGKGVVAALRSELAAGRPVEVAGYGLSPALAEGLESATLQAPPPHARVVWLEVSSRAGAGLLPASASLIERWRAAGVAVDAQVVGGPAFWQTVETEVAPALIDASCAALAEPVAA